MPKFTFQWNSAPKLTLGAEAHRLLPKLFRAEVTRAEHQLPLLDPGNIPSKSINFIAGDLQYQRGELTIASDGIYQFRLSARADANANTQLYLYIVQNQEDKLKCTSSGQSNGAYLRCSSLLNLRAGDRVWIRQEGAGMFSNNQGHVYSYFEGEKVANSATVKTIEECYAENSCDCG